MFSPKIVFGVKKYNFGSVQTAGELNVVYISTDFF